MPSRLKACRARPSAVWTEDELMAFCEPNPTTSESVWPWRALTCALILTAAGLHVLYLARGCPLDLSPDEAHYWDWSRQLDWSYYSKGPLVAYLIRGSCALFGAWSERLTGSGMLAVRLPAVLCSSLLLASLYVLTAQVYRRERLATAAVALALTVPLISAGASLITIDAPYTCCWGWALVAGHRAVFRRSAWAWPVAGFLVGLGILAKYTMVLWVPSLGLFLLATPAYRPLLWRRGFWVMVGTAALCCVPILVWNAEHEWVSLKHVQGQAGLQAPAGVRWLGPFAYLGVQFGILLGFWFIGWAAAMVQARPGKETDPGVLYVWWLSAPMFVFFLLFSLRTVEEANWAVTTYISGLVLAVAWTARQLRSPRAWYRRLAVACLTAACALGLALSGLMHFSTAVQPVLAWLSGPPTDRHPLPLRRFDPTCRLRGWRTLAAEVDRLRAELRAQGVEPVLAGAGWSMPGELAFYCAGHPSVYSLGLALGDRHSQYDLWRPNPVSDAERFAGRTFLFVGGGAQGAVQAAFDAVEPTRLITYYEGGQPIGQWAVTVCRGFHGFPRNLARQREKHF
jgi:hypothetical protein